VVVVAVEEGEQCNDLTGKPHPNQSITLHSSTVLPETSATLKTLTAMVEG
jgi:hypothetical protein